MKTRIAPIEKPTSLWLKLAYFITEKRFGKVITPLKVIYSRLPLAFSIFSNKISVLDKKLSLDKELALLIKTHVAQLNTCSFCIDIGRAVAIKMQKHSDKFYHLYDYRESPLFSKAERAALTFAEELTKDKRISDATYAEAESYFSERQLIEIAWLVATEHYYNIMNVAFDVHSDQLCDLTLKDKIKAKEAKRAQLSEAS